MVLALSTPLPCVVMKPQKAPACLPTYLPKQVGAGSRSEGLSDVGAFVHNMESLGASLPAL